MHMQYAVRLELQAWLNKHISQNQSRINWWFSETYHYGWFHTEILPEELANVVYKKKNQHHNLPSILHLSHYPKIPNSFISLRFLRKQTYATELPQNKGKFAQEQNRYHNCKFSFPWEQSIIFFFFHFLQFSRQPNSAFLFKNGSLLLPTQAKESESILTWENPELRSVLSYRAAKRESM